MSPNLAVIRTNPTAAAATIIVGIGLLTMAGFLFFQHGLGYAPCALCFEQRYPFYFSVPMAALLWLGAQYGASRKVLMLGFATIALAMFWNTGLAIFHAGVEWKFWPGPQDCSGPINSLGSAGSLLNSLQSIRIARCDDAAWRFLGISLAGYNVPVSLFMALVASWGFKAALARRDDSEVAA